ncbi:MAG: type II toxin-antitoxin system PemK/MazF family toxin [Verrucomicrobia bacterium]|nr:type II toxin-antitoxin system PemK/MazF family toxin [Verrucomicrobiota bacterium]
MISHPLRAARKDIVEVLDCSSQTASRPPAGNEVVLDEVDGLDWPSLCKCDCIFAVPREEVKGRGGTVTAERRRQIVRAVILSHGWNAL